MKDSYLSDRFVHRLRNRLLYPIVFLAILPLYGFLTFVLNLYYAFSLIITVVGFSVLFLAFEIGEGVFSRNRRAKSRVALDAYYLIMGLIVSTSIAEIYVRLGTWIANRFTVTAAWHTGAVVVECILAIVLMDFCAYWIHRRQHRSEKSVLWRSHSVHHALPVLDVVAGAQVHIFDGLISASPLLLLAGIGFSPEACGAAFVMNLSTAGIHHTGLGTDLRWFNLVTIAPQTHRWHHADHGEKTVNYGFVFSIWDILFDTFSLMPDTVPANYGARSIQRFPDSVSGHILVGTTAKAYYRLVKAEVVE